MGKFTWHRLGLQDLFESVLISMYNNNNNNNNNNKRRTKGLCEYSTNIRLY